LITARTVDRDRELRRVLVVTLILNLAVAAAKIVTGLLFNVISMTADGLHSALDGLNNIVGIAVLGAAQRPPDADHPYGHRKFETLAALAVAVLLGMIGAGIIREAIARFGDHKPPISHWSTFAVTLVTLVVNIAVARYEARRGRALGSEFLVADSHHTRSDAFVSMAVLGALSAVALGLPILDLVVSALIVLFIGRAVWLILAQSLTVLSDAAALPPERVSTVVERVPGVRSCHKVRSRGPENAIFVDLHIQVDPEITTAASHRIAHEVVAAVKRDIAGVAEVLVHAEPYYPTGTAA
jgi:cation diffusion facilitator family transporter